MIKTYILLLVCVAYISAATNPITYTYKTVGDLKIDLDVYIPDATAPTTGYPIFFAIHGGGDFAGNKKGAFTAKQLAEALNRGWAVVSVNYRLIPGVFLADILEDVQEAYQYVRTELTQSYSLDLDHVTIFGQSAGGGLAVLSGYKFDPRPQAIIAYYPFCTNWTDPYFYNPKTPVPSIFAAAAKSLSVPVVTEHPWRKGEPKSLLWSRVLEAGKMGWFVTTRDPAFPPSEILSHLKSFSATENVDAHYPPTFLGHGLADSLVPYSQSVQMANKLKEFEVPYVLDLVENAKHSYDKNDALWEAHILPAFEFAQKYMQTSDIKTKTTIEVLEI